MKNQTIFDLSKKVAVITGGNGHLGTAMSEILAHNGATVIIASRDAGKNNELCKCLSSGFQQSVDCLSMDISNEASVENGVKFVLEKYGKIDILVNNSYFGAGKQFLDMTQEQWLTGIDGSINGVFRVTKKVLKGMVEQNYGKIINIASMYGVVAPDVSIYEGNDFYNPVNYGVGKAGIIQFTKYIGAVYGKHGITCNAISPGPFPNPLVQQNAAFVQSLTNKVPLGRIGHPDDLKGVVALLASDASSFINGANICVDGGWTIW